MVLAIVTGAANGIGRSAALQLAKDGFEVAIIDLPTAKAQAEAVAKEISSNGGKAGVFYADVSKKSQFEAAFKDAVKQLGPLDVMVNNAGVSIMDPIELISEKDLQTMFDVNVKSCIWGMQLAIGEFKRTGHKGKIINAASSLSHQGMPTVGAYAMSKACIKSLTQTAAKEYADLGIMVNCYCPGPIRTDLFEGIVEKSVKLGLASADEVVELQRNGMIMKKFGTTEEIADIISFLASPRRKWITGQGFTADGGLNFV
ncbi:PFAM Short-chain dehydrogenase reductase SDR [Candidozyma auris]|uniref:3-oxoacyl-[acyl-carrier-protein] reductase n=2 Tax=Candidozyma auris TaxID=498019 RepID=A0A2H0ZI14_CANAR|nr:diacetyl reductase [[Candida] auris]PIS50301.1 hypothetical protein B9J08_004114 [[Candida] auris]QWW25365.1 hypothetical protein CA7LBN_004252 [[Candida] auris]